MLIIIIIIIIIIKKMEPQRLEYSDYYLHDGHNSR